MSEDEMLSVATSATSKKKYAKFSGLCSTCGTLFYVTSLSGLVCSRECRRGQLGPSWSGGRVHDAGGYVDIYMPEHPRADKHCYIAEHVLVMEKHLGRYLKTGENIHHKNGVRDDNRLDNLELWISYQPKGQRVDDLLNFIATHYPEEMKAKLASTS